jgi:hypothetical protein
MCSSNTAYVLSCLACEIGPTRHLQMAWSTNDQPKGASSLQWCSNITSGAKRDSSVHRMQFNMTHLQRVDAILHPHRMDVCSSGTHAIYAHEVLEWSSIGHVPILTRHYMSFSTALVPQLQLRHLRWSVSAQSTGDVHSQVS